MGSADSSPQVFVTGAGFTRAFVKDAPLLVDDFNNDELETKVKGLHHASRLLVAERNRHSEGHIDMERLMTRLYESMPYDRIHHAETEYTFLLEQLEKALVDKIEHAQDDKYSQSGIQKFAGYCITNLSTCITFNYDDYLDYALWRTNKWLPDWGYGFFCRSAISAVSDGYLESGQNSYIELLKLHGSINWWSKLGNPRPLPLESIVHYQKWPHWYKPDLPKEVVDPHLDVRRVIVPPVLTKSSFVQQPVLQVIWTRAFENLSSANSVTFIGYSFPPTDLAAISLFSEALVNMSCQNIRVIDFKQEKSGREELKRRYCSILGTIPDENFYFDGADSWIDQYLTNS